MRPIPITPGPGQESVWDYPRPPRLEHIAKPVRIVFDGRLLVDAPECYRVLETSHPPVYYFATAHIAKGMLMLVPGSSFCEWKGEARYFDVVSGHRRAERAAWCYPHPSPAFVNLAGMVAFYAHPMDSCSVGDQPVTPQPGNFYGGWITPEIVGPFKGIPGSMGW